MSKRIFSVKACLSCGWKRRVQVNKGYGVNQEEADVATKPDLNGFWWSRFCTVCVLQGQACAHRRIAQEKETKAYVLKARRKVPVTL